MRTVLNPQLMLDEIDIGAIWLDPRSRDDIPQLLRGLQYIYTTPEVRAQVFDILQEVVPQRADGKGKASIHLGRPGMEQWRILVLGALRLNLNADYDRVAELANQHKTVRQMLGHPGWIDEKDATEYTLQTLKDNLHLFTPDILVRISEVVTRAGHELVKKNGLHRSSDGLSARVDSFVVETDVHYPTDIHLLWDAVRKIIQICARQCSGTEWRQSVFNQSQFKGMMRRIQNLKHSSAKDPVKREAKKAEIIQAHREYIERAAEYLRRARKTREELEKSAKTNLMLTFVLKELDEFMNHAERQIDQIRRRVLEGQTIPHEEKVFSLFEPHTEWISKGKAGVPQELGLAVAIVEDQHGFILNHRVMEKTTDSEVAVSLVEETRDRFGTLQSVSFDKGFHSSENQKKLEEFADRVVLPKKGNLNAAELEWETDPEFVRLRKRHSAVESGINALEHHGLDRCLDHGLAGFKRYVSLAVLSRNVLRLGQILRQQELHRKREPDRQAA